MNTKDGKGTALAASAPDPGQCSSAPIKVTTGARDAKGLAGWREACKLLLRSWRHRSMSREWLAFINTGPLLRALIAVSPRLIVKPYRPYFSTTLAPTARLAVLRSHYEFIVERGLGALCVQAAGTAVTLSHFAGKSGTSYRIALRAIEPMEREGELVLQLACGDEVICSIAFNVFRDEQAWLVGVGCLQGPKAAAGGGQARELVRAATRDMHGLRPKHLMIRLLSALGKSLGCHALRLVGNANRAVRKAQRQGKVFADYDAFWRECGALARADGDHQLACEAPQPPDLAMVPSHKRSAARQRHALLLSLADGVRMTFAGS